MKFSFDEQILIRKAIKRLEIWYYLRKIILILSISCLLIPVLIIISNSTKPWNYYFSLALGLSCSIGSIIGIMLRNWNGLKTDILLSKLVEYVE